MEMITPILYFIVLHRRSEEAGLSDIRPEMPASLFLIHFHVLEPIMSEITNVDVIPTLTNELFMGFRSSTKEL